MLYTTSATPISSRKEKPTISPSFRSLKKPIFSPYYVYFGNAKTKTLVAAFDDLDMKAATIGFVSAPKGKVVIPASSSYCAHADMKVVFSAKYTTT